MTLGRRSLFIGAATSAIAATMPFLSATPATPQSCLPANLQERLRELRSLHEMGMLSTHETRVLLELPA